jgi:tetratricopeptide (TPR) repeat protein
VDYSLGIALTSYYLGRTHHLLGDHLEARRLLTESLDLAKKLAYHRGVTQSLNALGRVAYDLGEYQAAKHYLLEALKTTQQHHATPLTLDILTSLANLLIDEGQTQQAMELLAFSLNHTASKKETRDKADRLLAELAAKLPGDTIAPPKSAQLEEIVAKILTKEVGESLPLAC